MAAPFSPSLPQIRPYTQDGFMGFAGRSLDGMPGAGAWPLFAPPSFYPLSIIFLSPIYPLSIPLPPLCQTLATSLMHHCHQPSLRQAPFPPATSPPTTPRVRQLEPSPPKAPETNFPESSLPLQPLQLPFVPSRATNRWGRNFAIPRRAFRPTLTKSDNIFFIL